MQALVRCGLQRAGFQEDRRAYILLRDAPMDFVRRRYQGVAETREHLLLRVFPEWGVAGGTMGGVHVAGAALCVCFLGGGPISKEEEFGLWALARCT
ncbi:hypothetical protein NDU88_000309 [Pleurodeles waltl]|uniref:Uncharacterized protein n=1 Tax=Pleurodeles waltl TaxID=8319 RepID=A0AAV7Q702_PLEWA|nr:hypothetical protein NDU88_000309 [Pleurodeles waltl]